MRVFKDNRLRCDVDAKPSIGRMWKATYGSSNLTAAALITWNSLSSAAAQSNVLELQGIDASYVPRATNPEALC